MNHEISLAVWDVPSPIAVGRRATVKVGISCSCGCALAGAAIEIRDEQDASIATGHVGSESWPGTTGLHWVQLDVVAPEKPGMQTWRVHASVDGPLHARVESVVSVLASKPPQHRVTFEVVEQGSRYPVAGVELRVGAFRATTNETGRAHVDVPVGTYDVYAWKIGHDLLATTAHVAGDLHIPLQIAVTLAPDQPYWM